MGPYISSLLILFFGLLLILGRWDENKSYSFLSFYCWQFTIDNCNKDKRDTSKDQIIFSLLLSYVCLIPLAFFCGWVSLTVIQSSSQGGQGLRPMHVNNAEALRKRVDGSRPFRSGSRFDPEAGPLSVLGPPDQQVDMMWGPGEVRVGYVAAAKFRTGSFPYFTWSS